jgi:hypothetical protein
VGNEDVRWFEIEVDDASVVDEMQTLNGLKDGNPQKPSQFDGPVRDLALMLSQKPIRDKDVRCSSQL